MANSARIDELKKKFDENPRRYFAPLANEYRKAGDPDQAIAICREFLPQQPGHMSGHIVYGQALFDAQQFEEARTIFDTALTLDPENLIALRHLGDIARNLGEVETARSWYQRVLDADPRNDEIAAILTALAAEAPAAPQTEPEPAPVEAGPSGTVVIDELRIDGLEPVDVAPEAEDAHPAPEVPAPERFPEPVAELPVTEVIEAVHVQTAPADSHLSEPPAAPAPPAEELLDLEEFQVQPDTPVAPRISTPRASLHAMGFELERGDDESFVPGNTGEEQPVVDETSESEAPAIMNVEGETDFSLDDFTMPPAPAAPSVAPSDPFATETMAELYLRQGHVADALRVYRQLLEARPADAGLQAKVADLESRDAAGEAPAAPQEVPDLDASGFDLRTPVQASAPVPEPAAEPSIEEFTLPEPERAPEPEFVPEPAAAAPEAIAELEVAPVAEAVEEPLVELEPISEAVSEPEPVTPSAAGGPSIREFLAGLAGRVPALSVTPAYTDTIVEAEAAAGAEAAAVMVMEAPVEPVMQAEAPMVEAPDAPRSADIAAEVFATRTPAAPPAAVSPGGSIDGLFGAAGVSMEDQEAASTLAGAFGAVEAGSVPTPTTPMTGAPARRATEELSLDSVFREPSESHTPERGGFSFDRFFSGGTPALGSAAAEATPRGGAPESPDDDIEQFNSWLDGLKKR